VNIFLLTETESGCYKWRSAIPGKYLRRRGHSIQYLSKELRAYQAPDVLVISRAHFMEAYKIVEWCKQNSIRIVFDTDDALDRVPPGSLYYQGLQGRMGLYEFLLEEADVVTTTTEALAQHLRTWNSHVVVIPNSVDPEEWQPAPRGSQVRVGWSGAVNHFEDLALIADAIHELQKKHPFTFVLQGICQEPSIEEFYQKQARQFGKNFTGSAHGKSIQWLLDKLASIRYEFHPSVEIADHPGKLCELGLDIGIAPLAGTDFNAYKSCIKYYEYAMAGAITVASQVAPYSTEVPTTAKNNRESWKQKLEWALAADREPLWREQRDWVLTQRNIEKNVELWEQVLRGDSALTIGAVQPAEPVLSMQHAQESQSPEYRP
jgi:glycosyltransferase involved in cell wall biosynthesis